MGNDWVKIQLPRWRHFGSFTVWGLGRLTFSASLFVLDSSSHILSAGMTILKWTRGSITRLVKVYDQLPYSGTYGQEIIDTTATAVLEPEEIITDLVRSLDGKHVLLIGDTGTGKTTIAQWLAYQIGNGDVTVYDPDASPDEWVGLNVVGRGGDFNSIQGGMEKDLEDLQDRVEIRGTSGDRGLLGKELVSIAEEFPLLKDEVSIASEWLIKHARRGRRYKRFVIAIAQDDNVVTLGIEGQGGVRKCFRMIRLGKFAVMHAKSLKDTVAVSWLQSGKYRCMVDDSVCQLPDLSGYKVVVPRLQPASESTMPSSPTTPTITEAQPDSARFELPDEVLKAVKIMVKNGISDTKIIKEYLGYSGSQYQRGKDVLHAVKAEKNMPKV